MLVRDCTDGVIKLTRTQDIEDAIPGSNYTQYAEEADGLIVELNQMGVGVYLAPDKYFLRGTAGVYYTVGNDLFLNESYVNDPSQYIETLRHEGWHAAQDAMAGTIDNNNIAIIRMEEDVPRGIRIAANIAYGEENPALPWEREAKWAGATENMTLEVLQIINATNNKPWEVIEPTPMTREWLERNGFM